MEPSTEQSLFRLWAKYRRCAFGIISAFCGERTETENASNSGELKATLLGGGYSATAVCGVYRGVEKRSFLIFDQYGKGTLKRDLVKLGEKYGQDFIAYSEPPELDAGGKIEKPSRCYLIGTSRRSDSLPGYREELPLAEPPFGMDGGESCPFAFHELAYEPGDLDYEDVSRNHGVNLRGLMARLYRKACADSEDEVIPYD